MISTERINWEVSEQIDPNDYLPTFSQKRAVSWNGKAAEVLFSTCWNGWISYTEQKWLFCLQFVESQDSSPHLGATELWQSVILELFLHAPRRRGVTLLSVYSRNCLNYLQWTEGQLWGEDEEAGAMLLTLILPGEKANWFAIRMVVLQMWREGHFPMSSSESRRGLCAYYSSEWSW